MAKAVNFTPSPSIGYLLDRLGETGAYAGKTRTTVAQAILGPAVMREAERWGITLRLPTPGEPTAESDDE